ncbi:hypothetical protein D9M72_476920 [compost metagenome]
MGVSRGNAKAQQDAAESGDQIVGVAAEAQAEAEDPQPQQDNQGAGVEREMPGRLAVAESGRL